MDAVQLCSLTTSLESWTFGVGLKPRRLILLDAGYRHDDEYSTTNVLGVRTVL